MVSVLCEDVLAFDVQYLEPITDTWLDSWDSSQSTSTYTFNRLPLQVRIRLTLKGGEGDRPIKLATKVMLGIQSPLSFALPKNQLQQILSQQARGIK